VPEQPIPERDPIVTTSYAVHYLIAAVLMIGTLFWALWDEAYGQRPWKKYQSEFSSRYTAFLKTARSQSAKSLEEITGSSEYKKLEDDAKATKDTSRPRENDIQKKIADVDHRVAVVQVVYIDAKARVGADTYDTEITESAASRQRKAEAVRKERTTPKYEVDLPEEKGKKYTYNELEEKYLDLKKQKAALVNELAEAQKSWKELEAKRDTYLAEHSVSLSPAQLDGLRNKYASWDPKIMQINVADANIVDRCESCHIGAREPVNITASAMTSKGSKPDMYAAAFVSHPDRELLGIHDPDKFGCSTCHQGNGRATTSIEKAHGTYEHWLWPLFKKANVEAGCQTCHAADMVLAVSGSSVGQTINTGKDLFRVRGCTGCHRYEGYDKEPEDLVSIGQQIKQAEGTQKENLRQAALLRAQADKAASNEEANQLNQRAEALIVGNSKLAARLEQLDLQSKSLLRDMKKVGPNLKDIRAKLNRNWIPVWLEKPTDFRPTTKMPNFRLTDDQRKAIAAYIWQAALKDAIPHAKPGDAAHGKDLFETRGCLACHSIGEGEEKEGGVFAANLSRVGEKVNYDYLVRWIHDPRHRIRPYCPYEKKDIGPEDYAKKGLPYQFDLEHTTCPNDGHELQVQQMTVMPVLRLTDQDASDIASYLITRKQKEPSSYPDAAYMEDAKLAQDGKQWIRHYGCAGCHEISGFEDEGRIGTELTAEGSKPLERLDFSLLTHVARMGYGEPIDDPEIRKRLPDGPAKGEWYDHKGFFEHKLAMPNIFDKGKIKNQTELLRMPDPHLTREQISALTTFLMGSQETSLPPSYQYRPEDARHDIQEGWWIVKKYNCIGCHQFYPGQQTVPGAATILETLPVYKDAKEKLPPKLLTEGARVDPEWLLRFLSNPALSQTDVNRNGVRPYLAVRMPTFNFSPNELRKLVRFFQALSQQPQPYIPLKMVELSPKEKEMGRSLFSSTAAPCLKCHATGDPAHDKIATAPNFLLAKERLKPGWTERWIIDPQAISPGTSMPSNLFRKEGEHWVFNGPTPSAFQGYDKDHTKLLVNYIFQLTPEEQRAVSSRVGKTSASAPRAGGTTKTSRKVASSGTARAGGR
jgi:cytochrome c551/c552